jgi:ribosomal protein S18 acetylase RimI-like enzyme
MQIRPYLPGDENDVIELWRKCELTKPWNNPKQDIERKLKVNPELFLVGLLENKVVATVMGGYDGHRGWIHYLAVDPGYQRRSLGRQMMEAIEEKILEMSCPKINLQIRAENTGVIEFYNNVGFKIEDRVSMRKRLVDDEV